MKGTSSEPVGVIYDHGYTYAAHNYNTSTKGVASLLQYENGQVIFDFFDTNFKIMTDASKTLYIEGVNKLDIKKCASCI